MTVRRVVTASGRVHLVGTGYSPVGEVRPEFIGEAEAVLKSEVARALAAADRANNAVLQNHDGQWSVQGDPTEGALIVAALKAGLEEEALNARFERVSEIPFSSERKLMSTIHADAEHHGLRAFTKGAPDVLLGRCSHELVDEEAKALTDKRRADILATNEALAGEALRTLGVAFRSLAARDDGRDPVDGDVERDLVFLGLIGCWIRRARRRGRRWLAPRRRASAPS